MKGNRKAIEKEVNSKIKGYLMIPHTSTDVELEINSYDAFTGWIP